MAASQEAKPPCDFPDALDVLRTLRDAGHVAYFAGGCVRDRLLGQEAKDWDIATNALPARVRSLFHNTQAVGAAFGVILVRHRHSIIEVATFRADGDYHDGRRPSSIEFADEHTDAARRDFTINGLYWDPINDRVIDHVHGVQDLNARVIRAIGSADARFAEDHLRMLRAVRFASRFDFDIESNTARAIRAHHRALIGISPERIADEMRAMLRSTSRHRAFHLLASLGLLGILMRFFESIPVDLDPTHATNTDSIPTQHTPKSTTEFSLPTRPALGSIFDRINPDQPISFGLVLAGLVLDWRLISTGLAPIDLLTPRAAQQAASLMRRTLRISNDEAETLEACLKLSDLLDDHQPLTVARVKRFLAKPHTNDARQLLLALASAGHHVERIETIEAMRASFDPTTIAPTPLVSGDDLVARGHSPGPAFRRALDLAYDAQLEHRISTHAEAIALAEAALLKSSP